MRMDKKLLRDIDKRNMLANTRKEAESLMQDLWNMLLSGKGNISRIYSLVTRYRVLRQEMPKLGFDETWVSYYDNKFIRLPWVEGYPILST